MPTPATTAASTAAHTQHQTHAGQQQQQQQHTPVGSGTNSPPCENGRPMGLADIDGKFNAGHVSDREQRKEYFDNTDKARAHGGEQYVGQSMADEMDRKT